MQHEHKIKIFTCKASREFALKVAKALNLEIGDSDVLTFSDGEFQPCYNESVRGATVFIFLNSFILYSKQYLYGIVHLSVIYIFHCHGLKRYPNIEK